MTKAVPSPDARFLHECLIYNPEAGSLTWKHRPIHHFKDERSSKSWNSRYAGTPAFTAFRKGYRVGNIGGKTFNAHRVIWKMMTGVDPGEDVDHEDRNRSNNRWNNLREANGTENNANSDRFRNGSIYSKGVSRAMGGRFRSYISLGGKQKHLGVFDTEEEAARVSADARSNFYGKFAAQVGSQVFGSSC